MLTIKSLSLSYNEKPAFQNISLKITKGKITAIIGPSGCGKSSFLSCLNRMTDLIPFSKVQGTIQFEELDVFSPQIDIVALRRRMGMIFQKPTPFPLSIYNNIELPLRQQRALTKVKRKEIIEQVLMDVGLFEEVKDRLKESALKLSGGQQQRLCIARALALKPELILLDEPCSALDPISSRVVENLILRLREKYTIIIVTHNLAQAKRVADDVAFFWFKNGAGYLAEVGSCAKIFEKPDQQITVDYIKGTEG